MNMAKKTKGEYLDNHPVLKQLLRMLMVSVGILLLVFLFIRIVARHGQEYELPDMCGQALEDLERDNPLRLNYVVIDSVYDPAIEGGLVMKQDPEPGTMVKKKRKVYVTISTFGPSDVVLPELANMSVRSAVSAIDAAGLRCGQLRFVESPYRNVVLEARCRGKIVYAGQKMSKGDVVELTVGLGDGQATSMIPFVIGMHPAKARRALLSASLNVGQEHYENVTDRSMAVCYRMDPDYTGVSRYPFGTYVELWYCDASEADVQRIIANFQVDSSKIIPNEDVMPEDNIDNNDWDW